MSMFQRPNKTKSLFAQVDAGRPAAARVKLGGVEGSQSVMQNQTMAQGQENKNVQTAQNQVVGQTSNSVNNLKMDPALTIAENQTSDASNYSKTNPVFATSVAGGGGTVRSPTQNTSGYEKAFVADGTIKKQGDVARAGNEQVLNDVTGKVGEFQTTLSGYDNNALGNRLNSVYDDESKLLKTSEEAMTKGNLGQLADESDYEMEQAQLAQVLADRQSNVGKLKALYGVGYDTNKYGALDSNLLQGQFNDAAVTAKDNIEAKDMAQKEGARVRESYLDQIGTSKTQLDEQKGETAKRVEVIDRDISKAKEALTELQGRTDAASVKAAQDLKTSIDQKTKQKQGLVDGINKNISGQTSAAYTLGGDAFMDYFKTSPSADEANAIVKLGNALQSQKGNSPKEVAALLGKLSSTAISKIDPKQNGLSPEAIRLAIDNAKDKKTKDLLMKLSSAIAPVRANQQSNEEVKAESRSKTIKKNQETNKNILTGGIYGAGKRAGWWK